MHMDLYCLSHFMLAFLLATCSSTKHERARYQKRATVPGPVLDVNVYVYYPIRSDQSDISALVVWSMPDSTVPVTNFTVQVFNSNGMNVGTVYTQSNTTHACLESRSTVNGLLYILSKNSNYTLTVFASSTAGNGPPSTSEKFSTYAPSPPQELFAVGNSFDTSIIVNTNIQGPCPVAVNTIDREVYWYSSSKQLLRGYFDSNVVQNLVSSTLMPMMSNLTVLALAYDWVGERVYFAARAGGSFSLWRVPLINPAGLENVFTGPSINDSSSVQLIVDPFSGYAYWTAQEAGMTVLYQQNLRAVNGTIPTRRLDQSSTHIQLMAMTLDPTNGLLWVSDATTGNILSCDAMTWACSVEVNATALGNGGLPATSIALDEVHVYWTRQNTPGIFYMSLNGPATRQILSNTNPFAIFSTSPGQQPLPILSCLSYDPSTHPVPYQISATNSSILIGWSVPSLPSACQSTVFSFPTLTYVVDLRQFMLALPQYPAPGVITVGTTFTLNRGLSPFMAYNVQVAAYNQYTVALAKSMYNATTGVVAVFYGSYIDVMTTEGVPAAPQSLNATTISTQAIHLSWNPTSAANLRGTKLLYYVQPMGLQPASSAYANYTLYGLNPSKQYIILVITSNGVFNSTAAMVTTSTWPLPPMAVLLSRTNTSVEVMVNTTSVMNIIKSYSLKVLNGMQSNNTSNPVKVFTLTGLKANTQYSIYTVGTYISNEMQESPPLIIQTEPGVPDAPIISISTNFLLWNDVQSNDGNGITRFRLLINMQEDIPRSEIIPFSNTIEEADGRAYDLTVLNLCTKENETGIYYLTLFAQNSIGEGNGSNTVTYAYQSTCLGPQEASSSVIAVAAGVSAAAVIFSIAALFTVLCIILVYRRQKKTKQTNVDEDVDFQNVRFHSNGKIALNPQYTWPRSDNMCTEEDIEYFPKQNLKIESFMDHGEFGKVYLGTATDILGVNTGAISVAVKTLHKGASPEQQTKFLGEAALMRNFNSPYIVKLLGICIDADPICIIMELMPGGDLLHFLRDAKQDFGPALLTMKELIEISVDVAKGCCYLEQARFIHRDIAARNCLVSSKGADRVVKIGDFGLAKDLYSSDYYQVEGQRRLPIRWMAIEALVQGIFTLESDVWSYGVLLWEIMTLGNQPYPGLTNQEVLQFVSGGGRLDKPGKCPKKIYQVMRNCWNKTLSERPQFNEILVDLENHLNDLNTTNDSSEDQSDEENVEWQSSLNLERSSSKLPGDRGTQENSIISLGSQSEDTEVKCSETNSFTETIESQITQDTTA